MAGKDTRIDAYIANAAPFARPVLKKFRKIVHAACPTVEETIKWGMPHFTYGGGILCMMAAFKGHCAIHFWASELVFGGQAKRDKAMGEFGRITSVKDLPEDKTLLRYVRRATEIKDKGIRRSAEKKSRKPLPVPPVLADALKKNARARAAFENFSPTNQRDYIEWIADAKRDETRQKRLHTAVKWMAEGKTRNWKYMAKGR